MSRLLAIALGNTTASVSLASDGGLGDVRRVPIGRLENLKEVLAGAGPARHSLGEGRARPAEEGAAVIVASVNPRALAHLRGIAVDATGAEPEVAGEDFPIPIRAEVEEPEKVGADRLLACLAAYRRACDRAIVVDAGTAITVNAVSREGTFLGGAIYPGLDLHAAALAQGTRLLPKVTYREPESVIGKNTEEAILAGLEWGVPGAVTRILGAMLSATLDLERTPDLATVFLTGGRADFLAEPLEEFLRHCEGSDKAAGENPLVQRVPNLVLEGLVIAYQEWKGR